METPTPKKRRRLLPIVLGAIVLCVVLAFIGALLDPSEEPAAQPEPAAPAVVSQPTDTAQPLTDTAQPLPTNTTRPTNTPRPTATPTPVPTLEDQILGAIGRINRDVRAPSIQIEEEVFVTFPANDNLTTNMIRSSAQRQVMAIARAVRDNTGNAHDVRVNVTGPLIDAYGNTSESPIMRVLLTRATLEKINFGGFLTDNLPRIADDYWQHPAISE